MNFLDLCKDFVSQYGLAGGVGPNAVAGQTGELGNVVRWIRDADLYVSNLWLNWDFLWVSYTGTISAGDITASAPSDPPGVRVRQWETHQFKIREPGGSSWQPLEYFPRARFETLFNPDTATAGRPQAFTVMPDGTLRFDKPADVTYDAKGSFYRVPTAMTTNTSLPMVPEEFYRIILARACIMYADREDAPELVSGGTAEYADLLEKLEAAYLPGQDGRRRSTMPEQYAGFTEERWQ